MYHTLKSLFLILLSSLMFLACQEPGAANNAQKISLLYNQHAYFEEGPKLALLAPEIDLFVLLDEQGKEVFRAVPEPAQYWEASGDSVRKVDFSDLRKTGTYTVVLQGCDERHQLTISADAYRELSISALKAFYLNRTSIPIEEEYAGPWARPAGHPDTLVYVHASAADDLRPEGTVISSPLGWYDAGDYNKYVVNSGITTYTLLRALEDQRSYYDELEVNIPESGSGLPDLLSELLFNLRWVLSMQDPNDGGVYHKLTTRQFEDFVMPHEATNPRYVVAKSTAAALNYAALSAAAARILEPWSDQLPGLADSCRVAAEKAWKWAYSHPELYYQQPADIATGAYGDDNLSDEWFWAAAELYLLNGKEAYKEVLMQHYAQPQVPSWNQVETLGFYSLLSCYDELPDELRELGLRSDFLDLAARLVHVSEQSPYGVSIQHFVWGSNSQVANEGMIKLFAHALSGQSQYLNSAVSDIDYIMGRNATAYCFITGFGTRRVFNIHHRPAAADGIDDPIPGFLAGGPNLATFEDCPDAERSTFPAKSFVDLECSYSTNEIAINWNAPLVYLLGGLDARMTRYSK